MISESVFHWLVVELVRATWMSSGLCKRFSFINLSRRARYGVPVRQVVVSLIHARGNGYTRGCSWIQVKTTERIRSKQPLRQTDSDRQTVTEDGGRETERERNKERDRRTHGERHKDINTHRITMKRLTERERQKQTEPRTEIKTELDRQNHNKRESMRKGIQNSQRRSKICDIKRRQKAECGRASL